MSDDKETRDWSRLIDSALRTDLETAFAFDLRRMSVDHWPNLVQAARGPSRTPESPAWEIWQRVLAVDALLDFVGRLARMTRSKRDPRTFQGSHR